MTNTFRRICCNVKHGKDASMALCWTSAAMTEPRASVSSRSTRGLFRIWSGLGGVRVDAGEIELAGDEEQHGTHGGEAGITAAFAFGSLEEAVEGLDEAVGLTGLGPGDDAVEVAADHAGNRLHRRDPRLREGRLL